MEQNNQISEKRRLFHSLVLPVLFNILMWLIWSTAELLDLEIHYFGIYPLKIKGLLGIITAPLVHGDFWHIFNNTYSFLVLSWITFYFYRKISYRVFFTIYFFSGLGIWLFGREAYHIGASGIIYGLAFFVFMSGILRNHFG
ncbi:MAG: rhomboid family intramembrane serine protease, partial [Bacteroidota bacterium]